MTQEPDIYTLLDRVPPQCSILAGSLSERLVILEAFLGPKAWPSVSST